MSSRIKQRKKVASLQIEDDAYTFKVRLFKICTFVNDVRQKREK